MLFLNSILFGCEGSYQIFGTPVKFTVELSPSFTSSNLKGAGLISQLACKCINSHVFRWVRSC